MTLRSRVLLLYLLIALLVVVLIGGLLPMTLQAQHRDAVTQESLIQLRHIDFALSSFMDEARYDVLELSMNPVVRIADDARFTSFLNASEETFEYDITPPEQAIIDLFGGYQRSHPYVSSVYMGRENGAFVRSFHRARPTAYDPRDRPWYVLGRANPGKVVKTEPYQAVTTPDVNIGIVTALVDANGTIYGVVGADITLVNLTSYLASVSRAGAGEMLLVDPSGTVLAAEDPSLLFSNVETLLGDQARTFLEADQGVVVLDDRFLVHYTSPELGWKIGTYVPFDLINERVNDSIRNVLLFVVLALGLLVTLTLVGLEYLVIRPLSSLTQASRRIAETGDLDQEIRVTGPGEIASLGQSFRAMVEKIGAEERGRREALAELQANRDNLEEIVAERTRDLALAKEEAESADRLKSAFLATMSHELRTPLNSIIGFSGILLQELAGPLNPEQKKQLSMVYDSSEHLLALINDVLDISKVEAGEFTLADEQVSIPAVITKAVATVRPLADKKGLAIEMVVDPGAGEVRGDRRRIEQVFLNLLSNAVKFTDQGSVRVECSRRGGQVVTSIRDTGIGISEKDLAGLFRPFSQVDTGLTRRYEGTGLGLSISRKIMEMMGGTIEVESEVGKGSTFSVHLPSNGGLQ